jgi:hypothetical protein
MRQISIGLLGPCYEAYNPGEEYKTNTKISTLEDTFFKIPYENTNKALRN